MPGISDATAKTHLQHIYAKIGTSKQTELMVHEFNPTREVVLAGRARHSEKACPRIQFLGLFRQRMVLRSGIAPKSLRLSRAASRDGSISNAFL
jgi:hypothetical protein